MRVFAIYNRDVLRDTIPSYFKALSQYKPGQHRTALGKVLADQRDERSFFVARVREREEKIGHWRTHDQRGARTAPRKYYVTKSTTYVCCAISWLSHEIVALSSHPTQAEATRALRLHHAGQYKM